jgi:hypothetical protein
MKAPRIKAKQSQAAESYQKNFPILFLTTIIIMHKAPENLT